MKIIRTDKELETPLVDQTLRKQGHHLVLLPDGISESDLCREIADADILLMCYTPITEKVIRAAKRLRAIIKYGVGIDAIDIPAAKSQGVTVVNIPEYAEETVAEGAFSMMIALAKRLPAIQGQMRIKGWAWPERAWIGSDLAEKTIGIVGCGRIGKSMARMARFGFRMKVLGFDPHKNEEELSEVGIRKIETQHELLSVSDFVSIHAVLNEETFHLIGNRELGIMKSTSFLIN
ncbi:NAD(P)-dependent oxidoreductase [Fulvitalea axinellae]